MSNSSPSLSDRASSPLMVLRQQIAQNFSEDELETLCFDLGIDFDELGKKNKTNKIIKLIGLSIRQERLGDLRDAILEERPMLSLLLPSLEDLKSDLAIPYLAALEGAPERRGCYAELGKARLYLIVLLPIVLVLGVLFSGLSSTNLTNYQATLVAYVFPSSLTPTPSLTPTLDSAPTSTRADSPFVIDTSGNVYINQNIPLPTPKAISTIDITGLTTSTICVETNDVILVRANGGIIVGQFTGSVGPDGTDSGVFGLSLDAYDLYPQFPHGALLCKLDAVDEWRACKSSADFVAQATGCLEFNVNDNEQGNNTGFFEVEIEVFDN